MNEEMSRYYVFKNISIPFVYPCPTSPYSCSNKRDNSGSFTLSDDDGYMSDLNIYDTNNNDSSSLNKRFNDVDIISKVETDDTSSQFKIFEKSEDFRINEEVTGMSNMIDRDEKLNHISCTIKQTTKKIFFKTVFQKVFKYL